MCNLSHPTCVKRFVYVLGAVLILALLAFATSFALPAQTRHTRAIALKQAPEAVFTVLSDVEKFPEWNRNLEKVEILPAIDGKEATRQIFKGGRTMTVVTSESLAPTHLVRSVREISGNITGSWTYEITPTNDGCEVALTEKSHIPNPLLRLTVWLSGSTHYIDQHLVDLGKHFGEKPIVSSKRGAARR
jgi:hypothetical protein